MNIVHFFKKFASNKEAIEKMAEKPLTELSSSTMKTLGWQDTIKYCAGAVAVVGLAGCAVLVSSNGGSTGNYNNRIGNYGRKRYLK